MPWIRRAIRPLLMTLALLIVGHAPTVSQIGPDCDRRYHECLLKSLDWSRCYFEWFRCVTRQF